MDAIYLAAAIACIAGLSVRTGYEILKQEKKVNTNGRTIFSIVFCGMCLFIISWPILSIVDPWKPFLPDWLRYFGVLFAVTGLFLAVGGMFQLKGLENIDHLVTAGLYSKIRHPMYGGFMLWILGWMMVDGAMGAVILGVVCWANIFYWRHLEEKNLLAQFGEEYNRYKKTTWF